MFYGGCTEMSIKTLHKTITDMTVLSVQAKGLARGIEKSEIAVDEKEKQSVEELVKVLVSNCDTVDQIVGKFRRVSPHSSRFAVKK
jgi:hypothetical protein